MKLIKKEEIVYDEDVYNLHVKDDHNYIVNGAVVKNCHGASSSVITQIIDKLGHTKVRLGFTGTLNGSELHELEMIARFGRLVRYVTTSELMDSGSLTKLKVNFLNLKYPIDQCKLVCHKDTDYQKEIDYIINHTERNNLLVKLAMNQKNNTLMLFNYVDRHGKILFDMLLKDSEKHLKKIFYISGEVEAKIREDIRKTLDSEPPVWYDIIFDNDSLLRIRDNTSIKLKNGKFKNINSVSLLDVIDSEWLETYFRNTNEYKEGNQISKIKKIVKQVGCYVLIASYQTLSTGINIKNLHCLIFCHPLKAKIKTLQSIGRILRTCDNKDSVKLIDIVDDFSYTARTKKHENTVLRHFYERLKIYESEQFDYTITNYDIT